MNVIASRAAALLFAFFVAAGQPARAQAPKDGAQARPASGAIQGASSAFAALRTRLWDLTLSVSPETGTSLGLPGYDATWGDPSEKARTALIAAYESVDGGLDALEPALSALAPNDRIDFAAMRTIVRGALHRLKDLKEYRKDVGQLLGPYYVIQSQISRIEKGPGAIKAWQDVAARVEGIPALLKQARDNLAEGKKAGEIADKTHIQKEGIESAGEAGTFFKDELLAEAKKTLTEAELAALSGRLKAAGEETGKAYAEAVEFVKKELLPAAKESWALGKDEYAWRLKNDYGILESPTELNTRGTEIAASIRARMEEIAKKIDPDKSLQQVMDSLKLEGPADDKEMFAAYERISDRARDFVVQKKLFDLPSDYKLKIIPTPAGMRQSVAIAAYFPAPALDASKKGAFLVTPSDGDKGRLAMHSFGRIASIVVHEAFPGHDLQFWSFQRAPEISPVRHLLMESFAGSLNVEGYALYAEELMRQNGFFTLKEELAQLQMQMWRACRVIVDTAMHAGAMGVAEAAKVLREQAFLPAPTADAEAYRYTLMPTQAVTYMLGRLQIEDLKAKYKAIKGEAYSEAEFHKTLLGFGPVQPSRIAPVMLEQARRP